MGGGNNLLSIFQDVFVDKINLKAATLASEGFETLGREEN